MRTHSDPTEPVILLHNIALPRSQTRMQHASMWTIINLSNHKDLLLECSIRRWYEHSSSPSFRSPQYGDEIKRSLCRLPRKISRRPRWSSWQCQQGKAMLAGGHVSANYTVYYCPIIYKHAHQILCATLFGREFCVPRRLHEKRESIFLSPPFCSLVSAYCYR